MPDVGVYRLVGEGTLACLARVVDGEPHRECLDGRESLDSSSPARKAMQTGEPALVVPSQVVGCMDAEIAETASADRPTVLILPLSARGETVGLVELCETRRGRVITPEQCANAASVCQLIATSILDAEVLDAQKRQAGTLEEALAIVTRRAGETLGVSKCAAFEFQEELDVITARAMWEESPSGWERLGESFPLAEYPAGRATLETGQPLIASISGESIDSAVRALMERWNEKTCHVVPMGSVDGSMGLLVFWDSRRESTFSDEEMALATGLGELAGESVRSAQRLRKLHRLSETDSLTGLANHRYIHEFLAKEQARAERYGTPFSLVMLDIDGFKLFNDTYGHPVGDLVLREVAKQLVEHTRDVDLVGRYGGDEFMLVLPDTQRQDAALLVDNLRVVLRGAPYISATGEQIPLHMSFGVATYPADGRDVSGLVALADAHLYASK